MRRRQPRSTQSRSSAASDVYKRQGLNYARKYVIPANPNTAAQQTIRTYFTTAVAAYGAEDQATKDAWDAAIKKKNKAMTGFNFYVGLYVKYLIDNAGTPPTPPFMPPN